MHLRSTGRAPSSLAVVVVLAMVLGACDPEPPADPFWDAPSVFTGQVHLELTKEAPLTVRDIEIRVAPATGENGTSSTSLRVTAPPTKGIRLTLTHGQHSPGVSRTGTESTFVGMEVWGCEAVPCTVRLIAELTDPGLAGATVDAELELRSKPRFSEESLAADAMTVSITDPAPSAIHRTVVEAEASGEEVLDLAHPIVELHLAASFQPADVLDRGMLVGDAWLVIEVLDGADPAAVYARTKSSWLEEPYGDGIGELLGIVPCYPTQPCQAAWDPQLIASREVVAPIHVRWRFFARLIDYAVDVAPPDRTIEATATVARVGPDARAMSRTVSETMSLTAEEQFPEAKYEAVANAALSDFTSDGDVRLVMTEILTMTAVEGSGPRVRNQALNHQGLNFDADGRPHTDRQHHLYTCSKSLDYCGGLHATVEATIMGPDAAEMSQITIDWTLEVRLTVFGDVELPPGAGFELLPVAP